MSQDPLLTLPITSYALLGLLTFGDELTGYELKQRADNTLRFYWVAPAMSQIYTELGRLTDHRLVEPVTRRSEGRTTTAYRMTEEGRQTLRRWMDDPSVGFPVLKHTVLLRLLIGHAGDPARIRAMLEGYVDELADVRRDLRRVRDSLRGSDAPGQPFHYPSVVADWGLEYFAAEARHTRRALERLDAVDAVGAAGGEQ
jgi:DNA-binding PadR family transcriptional regulator